MTPGREPILLNRHLLALAVTFWPCFSWATAAQKDAAQSWTSGPTAPAAVAPMDVPAEGEGTPAPDSTDTTAGAPDDWGSTDPRFGWHSAQHQAWLDEEKSSRASEQEELDPWDRDDGNRPHRVPRNALWFGPGLAWSVPFGDLWGQCSGFDAYGRCAIISNVPAGDYFGSGPAFELDLGARLGRHYNVYGMWERTWFSKGDRGETNGVRQQAGESDFIALGLRVTTVPDKIGFVLDLAVGTRRMRARWEDGTELQLTDAPFETRIGLGADIRVDDNWSFTPLVHLGLGSFGKVEWVLPNGTVQDATSANDVALTHGWVGFQLSAHADILGSKD